jgi:hypothetical protein
MFRVKLVFTTFAVRAAAPADEAWLCLDPVNLSVSRRAVKLEDPAALALTAIEDRTLREALAPLFAELGELSALTPGHWYLRLKQPCELVTQPLPQAAGREVDPALPGGKEGIRWRRLLAEAQMLLHDHAINQAREAAGQPVVNSLWPWGAGELTLPLVSPFAAVWSDDPLVLGLARASGLTGGAPPACYEHGDGDTVVIIDDLSAAARRLDALAWREALAGLEKRWFAPLLTALRGGRCRGLHLAAFGPDASLALDIAPLDVWKFWRHPRPLAELAE